MINVNENKTALYELNEIISHLSKTEKNKIPKIFMDNLQLKMEKNDFKYDLDKDILDQNISDKCRAYLVEVYIKYLANEEEKNKLEDYRKICINHVESIKEINYKNNNLLNKKIENNIESKLEEKEFEIIEYKKQSFLIKIINKIKKKLFKIK